jgi:serine/threonine-protein kinase
MTSEASQPASGEPEKLKMPDDSALGAGSGSSRADLSRAGGAKGSSSIDTIIGRLVVDQGLATPEEVERILEHRKQSSQAGDPDSSDSLPLLLVRHDVITKRQLTRLKAMIEEERKGSQIPGYRVLGKLGAGAMATVFKAKQLSLDRYVAIKVLPRKYSQNAEFIARFYAEGKAAATLNHPNIVSAYDVGKAGEFHYFVMEFVDGTTVYDQIVKHRRFPEADAIDITIQIAEALKHAHERGLIHRDVKPKNIMFTREGVVKLADMGLAREMSDKEAAESEAGKAYGTPYYISPEQIRGEMNITPAADIYSLGATLYHMVTGNVPFEGKNPSDVMHKHLKTPLAPPDHVNPKLSAGFSQIIEMMMAKNVKERYQTCRDLLTDLQALRRGEPLVIARQDASAVEMRSLAAAEESMIGEVPEDKSLIPSVYSHPIVQIIVTLFVISVVVNIVALFIMFS